ncbi:PQQ-dependent sugar dehydrogenase [Alteraurantiacibacter palmitatis]|uniref:PQQ-dependent sugar dehydrogenase n=1 Tax=Alteraurantiacibacter palmitatis TaxID=2054628 RepID=A0ABV7E658_9SPHN
MHKSLSLSLFPVALFAASCGAPAMGDSVAVAQVVAGEAVELEAGSPFAASAHIALTEGWAIAVEPSTGNLLITEKGGTAKYYNPATGAVLPVHGLPEVGYGGQGGLGDVAFAPDYADSGMIYLSWAQSAGGEARRAVAARGAFACDASACTISGLTEIWRQDPAVNAFGHFSHKFAFAPDGSHLFLSSGDRMQPVLPQQLDNNLGKVLRLNLDGTPAAGNPFAAHGSPADQIWSYGQRNLLGLQFDLDGNLWDLEHGPRGGDELNLVEPGNNYGWPTRSYGINYNGDPIPDHTEDDGFVKPAIYWNPVIAPGDMLFYRGDMFPAWRGQALIAAMGSVTSIVRVSVDAANNSATEEARYKFPFRLRDIAEAADGSLWLVEDGPRGRLLHVTAAE